MFAIREEKLAQCLREVLEWIADEDPAFASDDKWEITLARALEALNGAVDLRQALFDLEAACGPVMTTLEILIAARAQISIPEKWCRGVYAVDADGNNILPTADCAQARCSSGALYSVRSNYKSVHDAWSILSHVVGCNFSYWQDEPSRTHAEVLAAWDAAIARARAA